MLYPSAIKEYFSLKAQCVNQRNEPFWLDWDLYDSGGIITDSDGHLTDLDIAKFYVDRLQNQKGHVIHYEEQLKTELPPLCFSLSSLQERASQLFDYDAEETLEIACSLHERHKAITCPLTDCEYIPVNQFSDVNNVLNALTAIDPSLFSLIDKGVRTRQSQTWNDKKSTAQHAIIPTSNFNVLQNKFSGAELNLYDLIKRQYIAQFFDEYVYIEKSTFCMIYDEPFDGSCSISKKNGWREVLSCHLDGDEQDELPYLLENEPIICQEVRIEKNYKVLWSSRN